MVNQIGETNLHVDKNYGTIKLYDKIFESYKVTPEDIVKLNSTSKEYYQLLVSEEEDLLKNCVITIPISNALHREIVPPEIYKRCSSLSNAAIDELKNFPAVICRKNTGYDGKTDEQVASLAYILNVHRTDSYVKLNFKPVKFLSQLKLSQNAVHFGLNMGCALTDLNRNEWSIHRVNLLKAISKTGILIETESI